MSSTQPQNPAPPKNKIVFVRVDFGEKTPGITVKAAGGIWNKKKKLRELPCGEAVELGLEDRIMWQENQNVSYMGNIWR